MNINNFNFVNVFKSEGKKKREMYARGPHYHSGWSDCGHLDYHAEDIVYGRQPPMQQNYYMPNGESAEREEYVGSNAEIGGQMDEEGRLQMEDLYGVQTAIIYPEIKGTLEQLQANPKKATWTMTNEVLKSLRHNSRTTNRVNADEKDMYGDLSKGLILAARVINTNGNFPMAVGLNMTGLEPRFITGNNKYSWVIGPHSGSQMVNQSIYHPNNYFYKRMYKDLEKCNTESLNSQIRMDERENHAQVDTRGFVWNVIMKNIDSQEDWQSWADHAWDIEEDRVNGRLKGHLVDVPKNIATQVHRSIKESLDKIESSFVDFRTFSCQFVPADKQPWNQVNGLIGESAGIGYDSGLTMKEHELKKPRYASAAIEIAYILN